MFRSKNALLAISLCAGLIPAAALAGDNNGGGAAPTPLNAVVGSLKTNHGHFVCTVAINSDGTIATVDSEARYIDASKTGQAVEGTGRYQVAFKVPCGNVQIANGWFRIVQPDTLTIGALPATSCIVADRVNLPSALFIKCFNSAGAPVNTSFTVSVSR